MTALLGVLRDLESAAAESARVQAESSRRRADQQHASNGYEHNGPAAEEGGSGGRSGGGSGEGEGGDGNLGGGGGGPGSPSRHDNASLRTLAAAFLLNGTFEEQMVQAFSATIERIDELLRDENPIGGGSNRGGNGGGDGGGGGGDGGDEGELGMRDLVRSCFAKEPLIYNGTDQHQHQAMHPQSDQGGLAEDEAAFALGVRAELESQQGFASAPPTTLCLLPPAFCSLFPVFSFLFFYRAN